MDFLNNNYSIACFHSTNCTSAPENAFKHDSSFDWTLQRVSGAAADFVWLGKDIIIGSCGKRSAALIMSKRLSEIACSSIISYVAGCEINMKSSSAGWIHASVWDDFLVDADQTWHAWVQLHYMTTNAWHCPQPRTHVAHHHNHLEVTVVERAGVMVVVVVVLMEQLVMTGVGCVGWGLEVDMGIWEVVAYARMVIWGWQGLGCRAIWWHLNTNICWTSCCQVAKTVPRFATASKIFDISTNIS